MSELQNDSSPATTATAPPSNDDDLITKAELAARLKKTQRTIDAWMAQGILPYYKLGRAVVFRWSKVLEHFEANHRAG